MSRAKVGAAALALLLACGDDPAPAPAPPAAAGEPAPIEPDAAPAVAEACTTLPRTFAQRADAYFHVFPTETAAIRTFERYLPQRRWRAPGSVAHRRAQAAANAVFGAYQTLYPDATKGLDVAPIAIIQETPSPNAFVIAGRVYREVGGHQTALYVLVFTSGYVEGANDAELQLIAAHEMGHLLLRNGDREYFTPIHYREGTNLFGEYETNDPEVAEIAQEIGLLGDRVGQLTEREFNGYPTDVGTAKTDGLAGPRYGRYLRYVHDAEGRTGPKADDCDAARDVAQQIGALVFRSGHLSRDQSTFDLGTDAARLDGLTTQYWQLEASCLAHVTMSYRDLVLYAKRDAGEDPNAATRLAAIGADAAALDAYLEISPAEAAADATAPDRNIAEKVAALGVAAQGQLRVDLANPEVSRIRVFTAEDDADSAAVRIGKILAIDPGALATKLLSTEDAEYAADCNEKLARDVTPAYGGFIDVHHGTCWRIFRGQKLAAALETCPETWPR
ncbi:MAG: hypothetical protein KIT84_19690 [Labilithrix sp.]|nr:hypothetical protein [Labilithrix sp.]MCW5813260.1 hypothetical protein [Labilithrix sp.]